MGIVKGIVTKNGLDNVVKLSFEDEEKQEIQADFTTNALKYYSLNEMRKNFNEEFKKKIISKKTRKLAFGEKFIEENAVL